jgi:hypothetical protein
VDIATAIEKLEEEWNPALGTGFFRKLYIHDSLTRRDLKG